jgi:predicted regulator of Ras-like GTPase activity (Roadblock/LC7/MglB family)
VSVIEERLRALRDMDSVYGSVVFSASGATIARDLPPSFDQQLLQSVGKRISLMFEAFQVEGEELDSCVMRYAEHRLHLRRASWGLLMVVTGGQVNTPALRMAINLVASTRPHRPVRQRLQLCRRRWRRPRLLRCRGRFRRMGLARCPLPLASTQKTPQIPCPLRLRAGSPSTPKTLGTRAPTQSVDTSGCTAVDPCRNNATYRQ